MTCRVLRTPGGAPPRDPRVLCRRAFEARCEAVRWGYRDLLSMALGRRPLFVTGFLAVVFLSFLLVPFLGRNFFPAVDAGNILMHVRTQVGTRVEETANQMADVQKAIRKIIALADPTAKKGDKKGKDKSGNPMGAISGSGGGK